jgi:hypothetical protein
MHLNGFPVRYSYPSAFLATVLQGIKAEERLPGNVFSGPIYPEDTTFFHKNAILRSERISIMQGLKAISSVLSGVGQF